MHRSVSQVKAFEKCPYAYKLERLDKVWARPAAWLAQGLAVHEAAEWWENTMRTGTTAEAQERYRESYAAHTNRMCKSTPNLDYWFASGPYRGEQDIERRFGIGLDQVAGYIEYYEVRAPEEKVWITPDDVPAVELRFDMECDGVKVVGYIDQLIDHPEHGVIPRDIKTGNTPGDDFQLAVYARAVEDMFGAVLPGLRLDRGDYWMGRNKTRKGGPTKPYDLTDWGRPEVDAVFKQLDQAVKAAEFEPKPSRENCAFCPVSLSCEFAM
ncbi:RecB family exonuclease [Kitasatospora purpeofusca]|uniref:RecB family exonuclease n=1 Tax=Kitasatospora purpeofusca TaxID=67352 RepID=UPI0036EB9194